MEQNKNYFWNLNIFDDKKTFGTITIEYNKFFDPPKEDCELYTAGEIKLLQSIFNKLEKPKFSPRQDFVKVKMKFYKKILNKFRIENTRKE